MRETLFGRVTVAGLVVALAVAGCGNPGTAVPGGPGSGPVGGHTGVPTPGLPQPGVPQPGVPQPGVPDPGAPTPGAPQPGVPDPGPSQPGPASPGPPEVAWVPPGPGSSGPIIPNGDDTPAKARRWHQAFDDRDCKAIAALGPERGHEQLYAGLGEACVAVIDHDDQQWPAAESAWQQVSDPASDCLDHSAFRLLSDLIAAHRRAPHATIRVVDAPPGDQCPADDGPVPGTSSPATPDAPATPGPSSGAASPEG